jgi:hypothetical protein
VEEHDLDGLWSYTTYEEGGVVRSQDEVARMAKIVLLVGDYLPGWHGLWAVITWRREVGVWSEVEAKSFCRHIVLETDAEGPMPASNFYLYAGGRFRIARQQSAMGIDFEHYWRLSCLQRTWDSTGLTGSG